MGPSQTLPEQSLALVREYVRDELSLQNRLERDAFPMAERVVTRKGSPIGFYFCMYGPRMCATYSRLGFEEGRDLLLRFARTQIN